MNMTGMIWQDQRKTVIQEVVYFSENNSQDISGIHIQIMWKWRMVLQDTETEINKVTFS